MAYPETSETTLPETTAEETTYSAPEAPTTAPTTVQPIDESSTPSEFMQPKEIKVPDLKYTPTAKPYTPPAAPTFSGREVSEEDTVAGRLRKLLDDKNPYSLASYGKQQGIEYAASRGLQNSLIAGTAGVKGVMDKVAPIATSDAQIIANAQQSAQDATQTGQLEGFRGEVSSGLSRQEAGQKLDWERIAQQLTGTRADKETFAQLSTGVQQKYQDDYVKIQTTADSVMSPAAKAQAIMQLNAVTQSQVEGLAAIYNVDMSWSSGIIAVTPEDVAEQKVAEEAQTAKDIAVEAAASDAVAAEKIEETAGYIDPGSYIVQQGLEEIGVDTLYEDLGVKDPAQVVASWF